MLASPQKIVINPRASLQPSHPPNPPVALVQPAMVVTSLFLLSSHDPQSCHQRRDVKELTVIILQVCFLLCLFLLIFVLGLKTSVFSYILIAIIIGFETLWPVITLNFCCCPADHYSGTSQRHRSLDGLSGIPGVPVARSGGVTVTLGSGNASNNEADKRGPFTRSVSLTFPANESSPTKVITSYNKQVSNSSCVNICRIIVKNCRSV